MFGDWEELAANQLSPAAFAPRALCIQHVCYSKMAVCFWTCASDRYVSDVPRAEELVHICEETM
jgi:hypothetical protein